MEQEFKRWYDHDPLMLKVINILKDYQDELREQATIFLKSVEEKVSKEAIERFCSLVKPLNGGNRWYDKDPIISQTVELLRVVPVNIQRDVAEKFLTELKNHGIEIKD